VSSLLPLRRSPGRTTRHQRGYWPFADANGSVREKRRYRQDPPDAPGSV